MASGYWEREHLLRSADITIVGAGLVGMSTALALRRLQPEAHIRIVERHPLTDGGSSRNAGFACFGSAGEWLDDLDTLGPAALQSLVRTRAEGLRDLIGLLGENALGLEWSGGWELFSKEEEAAARRATAALDTLNPLLTAELQSALGPIHPNAEGTPALAEDRARASKLRAHCALHLPWEGMLHTGKMVTAFHAALDAARIQRLHGVTVQRWNPQDHGWQLDTSLGPLHTRQLAICTNGFAADLLPDLDVHPVPNRVLVLRGGRSIPKGTYHLERGYLYMRTLGPQDVLFGGGRHWGHALPLAGCPDTESTWDAQLEHEAQTWLGPDAQVTHRWTGWLGVGSTREPQVGQSAPGLFHAVRMGGMGVAIGAGIGVRLADLIHGE